MTAHTIICLRLRGIALCRTLPRGWVAETLCAQLGCHDHSPWHTAEQCTLPACKIPVGDLELVCRPAFQAIIEALHQQMQQHLAAEKAAAAAASVAAAKRVSPFGAMSNLMKVHTFWLWELRQRFGTLRVACFSCRVASKVVMQTSACVMSHDAMP